MFFVKGVSETEAQEQKGEFLSKLLGTVGGSSLRNILASKRKNKAGYGNKRQDHKNKMDF